MKSRLQQWAMFWLAIFREYYAKHYTYHASALTFSSLLSIIPIITICITILSIFPFYNEVIQQVENFIFSHFIATSGQNIQTHLHDIVDNALHLSTWSIIFLAVVAIQMMNTLEQTLNTIWDIKKSRSLFSAIILYGAILIIAPLLMGTGFIINSLLIASTIFHTIIPIIFFKTALGFIPLLLSMIAFTLIYITVPNYPVPLRNGLQAGAIAALLFEGAKTGFSFYITHISDYQVVYGSLAAIPIFLLWIYISWCIVLLGALIARSLTIDNRPRLDH